MLYLEILLIRDKCVIQPNRMLITLSIFNLKPFTETPKYELNIICNGSKNVRLEMVAAKTSYFLWIFVQMISTIRVSV